MTSIISFAWTTPALLAGRKTRTRREWADDYASRFHMGDTVQAWDHVPRVKGAKRVGYITIMGLRKEPNSMMTDEDYEKEGFAFMEEKGLEVWDKPARRAFDEWRADKDAEYWVADFLLQGPVPEIIALPSETEEGHGGRRR